MATQKSGGRTCLAAFLLLAGASTAGGQKPAKQFSLRDCEIQVAENLPRYVHRAVEDLAAVIERFGGHRPRVQVLREPGAAAFALPVVQIGLTPADALDRGKRLPADRSHEGFVIAARSEFMLAVGGRGPEGIKFGVLELIRRLRVGDGDVRFDASTPVVRQPSWSLRSMYAHLHWSYERPYALRSWTIDDWKRYVDLLAHLGFNCIQMWPMMELLPHPLSEPDKVYLKKYAEIVDYAHAEWGMKAFIGSCPNNITEDAKGVPIEKREYFDFEKLLDPGVPENLERILEYRSDLYRTVPNADGYWVIDHDPGGWKGSPSSAFVDILTGHRKLIDQYAKRPMEQPLIYWMWMGWGTEDAPANYRATLRDMQQRLSEPWRIHVCHQQHLDAMKEMRLADRAIWFPYNLVEHEPSGPLTDLRLDVIRQSLEHAASYGLRAVQGNAQTPLAQLPNIAAVSYVTWGGEPAGQADAILGSLAERLVCREPETVVAAWKSLYEPDSDRSFALAERVERLARDESAAGVFAVVMGDWQRRVLEDLAAMLRIHGHALRFDQAAARDDVSGTTTALGEYLNATAAWLERTGYHNRRLVCHQPYLDPVVRGLDRLKARLGEAEMIARVVDPAQVAAAAQGDAETIRAILETVLGRRK